MEKSGGRKSRATVPLKWYRWREDNYCRSLTYQVYDFVLFFSILIYSEHKHVAFTKLYRKWPIYAKIRWEMHSDAVEELLAYCYRALKTLGNAQTVLETILAMIKEQWGHVRWFLSLYVSVVLQMFSLAEWEKKLLANKKQGDPLGYWPPCLHI